MSEPKKYDLAGPTGIDAFINLPEGVKITLLNGAVGEVTANPHDGAFVLVKWIDHPVDPAKVGEEEYVFFNEVRAAEG
ncbi:MAG: hypothetical protein ACKVVP_10740 [Chloroflexota bacterium]